MKTAARVITGIFHPLLMPTLGLFLILHSGTYLSLLDPSVKRAILFVMALGTLIFPLMMLPVLYYRNVITTFRETSREERLIPQLILLVLYVITFVYFSRLPVSRVIQGYVLSVSVLLLMVFLVTLKFKICGHMAALGGVTGLVVTLIIMYETNLQGVLMIVLMISGLTGSSRLLTKAQTSVEVYSGYLMGFAVVPVTLFLF